MQIESVRRRLGRKGDPEDVYRIFNPENNSVLFRPKNGHDADLDALKTLRPSAITVVNKSVRPKDEKPSRQCSQRPTGCRRARVIEFGHSGYMRRDYRPDIRGWGKSESWKKLRSTRYKPH